MSGSPTHLMAGRTYATQARKHGVADDALGWHATNNNPYAAGMHFGTFNGGFNWQPPDPQLNFDFHDLTCSPE
ncbi:MAG: hypothetical protein R3C05_01315 [Pirellulaceae bacterium]